MLNSKSLSISIQEIQQLTTALLDLKKERETKATTTTLLNKSTLERLLTCRLNNPEKFIKIIGGYSNETYRINTLVLRFPKLTNPLVRNLSIEAHNLKKARASELSPLEVIAYYSKHNQ
jgi:hypothetical protein